MARARRGGAAAVRLLGTLLVALAAAGPAGAEAQGNWRGGAALDLPAMALTPADLEAEGLDDYVVGVGNLTPSAAEAASVARVLDLDEDDVADAFADAGADWAYTMFLDRPVAPASSSPA